MNNAIFLIESNHDGLNDSQEQSVLMNKKHLKMLKKMKIGKSESSCSVCYDQYCKNEIIRILPCKHFFHYRCLKPWFKKSNLCPVCRLNIKNHLNNKINLSQNLLPNMYY